MEIFKIKCFGVSSFPDISMFTLNVHLQSCKPTNYYCQQSETSVIFTSSTHSSRTLDTKGPTSNTYRNLVSLSPYSAN